MTPATAEPTGGMAPGPSARYVPRFRPGLWAAVALVFAAQVGILFWLGNPRPTVAVQPSAAPNIRLGSAELQEWLSLQDPTIFILPHRDSFSGAGWMTLTPMTFRSTNWLQDASPLSEPAQLGVAFAAFMRTNPPPMFHSGIGSEGDSVFSGAVPFNSNSVSCALHIEGPLEKLHLLTPVLLPPQTSSDVLTNTEVQLIVNGRGIPFSPVVTASSKDAGADATALEIARKLRFEPVQPAAVGTVPQDRIVFGKLIFEWQTVPPAPTNTPPNL